jgi:beta-lactamase regulating signal transducer with metallopeptidase domain
MGTMISTLNGLAGGWTAAMLAVLWQSTILIAIAAIVAWLLRRSSPVVRYWLWQIVAIKLLLMPFWTFAVPWPAWTTPRPAENLPVFAPHEHFDRNAANPTIPPKIPLANDQKDFTPPPPPFWDPLKAIVWQAWLLLIWLAIVLCLFLRILIQRRRLSRLLGQGLPVSGELAGLIAELSARVGLRRPPATISVEGDCPLFVCGLWRPVLVLPNRLIASLGPAEQRQVILHELGHVKRRDLPWGWPVEIARTVYFFHPLVYWAAYQLRLERELACDQLAMAKSGHSPADYAQTLVQVVSHAAAPATAQTAAISAGLAGSEPISKQPSQPNDS